MTDKLKQTIKEEMVKLPKERQDAINAVDWVTKVAEIEVKHSLNETQGNVLQAETFLFLMGYINIEDFEKNIEKEIEVSAEVASDILDEIIDEVIFPIMDSAPSYLDNKDLTPEEIEKYNGVYAKLGSSATGELVKNMREELKSGINSNKVTGQKDFLQNLDDVITQSTKK